MVARALRCEWREARCRFQVSTTHRGIDSAMPSIPIADVFYNLSVCLRLQGGGFACPEGA